MVLAVIWAGKLDVKSGSPNTLVAAAPVNEPLRKNNTRLFAVSATYRLPPVSTATPPERAMAEAPIPSAVEVKPGCPKTLVAGAPLAEPLGKKSTRLFVLSAT